MAETLGKQNKADRTAWIGLAVLGALITFVICPFSPIYRYCFEPDEICYRIVSLGWLRGKLPYRDLFDHKGPLTYVFYALGFLLSNRADWGACVIFALINAGIFALMYKNLRLLYDPGRSFAAVAVLLCYLFIKRKIIYATGSKPDHIILLFLLLSEYIYIKNYKDYCSKSTEAEGSAKGSGTVLFAKKDMYLLGLCAGAVFMIKMNICVYYLIFIGFYFLWLILRRTWKDFLHACGIFLSGIASVCAPFFLYYGLNGALKEFTDAYFVFNIHYAKKGKFLLHFSRTWIPKHDQIILTVSFLMMCAAALIVLLTKKGKRLQNTILIACGAIVYFAISLPEVFSYSFCVIIPLYLISFGVLSDLVLNVLPYRILPLASAVLLLFVFSIFGYVQVKSSPYPGSEKKPHEVAFAAYYEKNPDAQCFMLGNLCDQFFYYYAPLPEFQYFYLPRAGTRDMFDEQLSYVRQRQAGIVVYYRTKNSTDESMEQLDAFFRENGYSLYYSDEQKTRFYFYTRDEDRLPAT